MIYSGLIDYGHGSCFLWYHAGLYAIPTLPFPISPVETHLNRPLFHARSSMNNILILGIWCSTIPHLPGCFCPWTFFENIGFNTVLTDPFMSNLATQLGYSAGEFQALQLIVLAAFGVVD